MKNTNCGQECAFVKNGFCQSDKECPNYIETWWKSIEDEHPKLVKDCFPKKFSLEQNALLHRFLSMQSALEQVRNRMDRLEKSICQLIDIFCHENEKEHDKSKFLNEKEIQKSIE